MADYGYGQGFVEPTANTFKAGTNDVKLSFIGLANYKTKAGDEGQALDFIFIDATNPSSEFRHRMFPIVEETLPARYQEYVQNAAKASQGRQPLSFDEFRAKQFNLFSGEVKAIITQFVPAKTFDESVASWSKKLEAGGTRPTFELFVGFINAVMTKFAPNYKEILGHLLLGYQPKSKYLTVPRYNRDCGLYFVTDKDIPLTLWESSKMVFTKPEQDRGGFEVESGGMPIIASAEGPVIAGAPAVAGGPVVAAQPDADDDDLPF